MLVATLAEGKRWSGRAQRPGWLHGPVAGQTGHGLTGHELVGPVPFLLIVMQCPQIDDNVCALVNGKVADAAREGRKGKEGSGILSSSTCLATCSALSLHSLSPSSLGKRAFYALTPTPSPFSQLLPDSVRIQLFSSPLFLTCTYVSHCMWLSASVRAHCVCILCRCTVWWLLGRVGA